MGRRIMAGWVIAWYGFSSFLLGMLLFWPLRKLILALSINRHQRRIQADIADADRERLRQRVTWVAAFIAMTFAFLYNHYIFFRSAG